MVETNTLQETYAQATRFVETLQRDAQAHVVGLRGDLGAGKTSFTQGVAQALGVEEHITSPTFVILKRFKLEDVRFKNLIHIDAYRLESGKELEVLGWEELAHNPDNLILLEWPERVVEALPKNTHFIDFTFIDETTRSIDFHD